MSFFISSACCGIFSVRDAKSSKVNFYSKAFFNHLLENSKLPIKRQSEDSEKY